MSILCKISNNIYLKFEYLRKMYNIFPDIWNFSTIYYHHLRLRGMIGIYYVPNILTYTFTNLL